MNLRADNFLMIMSCLFLLTIPICVEAMPLLVKSLKLRSCLIFKLVLI